MATRRKASSKKKKVVETLMHDDASRKNIPTAEYQSVMRKDEQSPIRVAYERRNRDLDPQLVWRGKDEQDWSDLVTQAPPLYIQEKVHPIKDPQHDQSPAQMLQAGLQQSFFMGLPENGINLKGAVEEFERGLITEALEKTNWVKNRAANLLGLNRTTLVEKLKKMNIKR